MEIIEIVDRIRRHSEAETEARRQRDVRAELGSALRAWFAGELHRLSPARHQPADTVLGERIGLPGSGEILNKGFSGMQLFATLTKAVEQPDGSLRVEGIVSSEKEDEQGEIVRASAMREAIPSYMRWANLRSMHSLDAIGRTLALDVGADGVTRIVGKIVDPVAITKIKAGVLQGFSIGGSVLEREAGNSRAISRLALSEISLVDRPCNPDAIISLWKLGGIAPQPVPFWDCGAGHQHHLTKEAAAWCRAQRSVVAVKALSKAEKKAAKQQKMLQKALNKNLGKPNDPAKRAAAILSRPIVPDSSDVAKRAQGFLDFQQLYYAGRQQLGGPRFQTVRR
jgi:Caudovirus prohead serine protease